MRGTNSEVVQAFFNHTPLSSHDGNLKSTPNIWRINLDNYTLTYKKL